MVVQKTINNLKERPHDERKAVAGGIAVFVVVILLGAWAILFFKKIQTGAQTVNFDSGAQSAFNPTSVTAAQQQINQGDTTNLQELYQIRNSSASNQLNIQQQTGQQQVGQSTDAFGNPNNY